MQTEMSHVSYLFLEEDEKHDDRPHRSRDREHTDKEKEFSFQANFQAKAHLI